MGFGFPFTLKPISMMGLHKSPYALFYFAFYNLLYLTCRFSLIGWLCARYAFFRFTSENFVSYTEGDDADACIELIKDDAKGVGGKV